MENNLEKITEIKIILKINRNAIRKVMSELVANDCKILGKAGYLYCFIGYPEYICNIYTK